MIALECFISKIFDVIKKMMMMIPVSVGIIISELYYWLGDREEERERDTIWSVLSALTAVVERERGRGEGGATTCSR